MKKTSPEKPPRRLQVNIQVPSELDVIYANFVIISHSPSEMILDFAQMMPHQAKTRVQARVVMTPLNAKLLHRALTENIAKYEAQFGEIKLPSREQGPSLAQQFFSSIPPTPEGES